jgi:hypothetical protein
MKIKKYYENSLTFEPLKVDDEFVYYELQVDNSIRKFELALDKIGVRNAFERYYNFDLNAYKWKIEKNIIIYLNITIEEKNIMFNLLDEPFTGYHYKGYVKIEDYELDSDKYNL